MSTPWQTSDLLDLDYFLNRSPDQMDGSDTDDSVNFDRAVYRAYAKANNPPFERRELIKHWLDEKRTASSKAGPFPGELYHETMSLTRILVSVSAFLFGAILSWSVLSYSGATPINIFTCVWVMIVPQLLLLGFFGLSALMSGLGIKNSFAGFYPLTVTLLRRMANRTATKGRNLFPARSRQRLITLIDLARIKNTPYSPVLFWPVFILAQLFGIWFNLGLLITTGLKLAITDLAFGWQSTLFPAPDTVLRMVKVFSLPWSWAVDSAHPTISQIEGSRMVLKDGIVHLTTPDLVSWWPFLICAILCYGLIPRAVLLAWGFWKQHRVLAKTSFSTGACDRLIHRLQTPRLQSAGSNTSDKATEEGPKSLPGTPAPGGSTDQPAGPAIVLIPEEIAHLFTDESLKIRISRNLSLDMTGRLSIEQDPDIDQKALKHLLKKQGIPAEALRLVVVTEAWQPPLQETITWLIGLRHAAGPHTGIILGLVGKPERDNRFTAPDLTDRKVWEQAAGSLNDPFTRIENLGDTHE